MESIIPLFLNNKTRKMVPFSLYPIVFVILIHLELRALFQNERYILIKMAFLVVIRSQNIYDYFERIRGSILCS